MTDAELLGAISAAEEMSLGTSRGQVATDRADAMDRYLGKPYGDEITGRSQVVSRDVADVVEGVTANVIKPFVGGDEIVQFEPRDEQDEEAAKQETDYINFITLERNNGFINLVSAVKDALLLRNGYIKAQWTVRSDVISETYQGLSDEEATLLAQDEDVEVIQHSEYPDPAQALYAQVMGAQQPAMLHDIKVRRNKPTEFAEQLPIPPDEIIVSDRVRSASLQDADFVQHRVHATLSNLRQLGYKVEDDISDDDRGETLEEIGRNRFGQSAQIWDDETNDPARRMVLFKESYIRIDRDGDGIAELRRVCTVGQNLLADDEADIIPIACFSGTILPHQHLGLSTYDMVKDVAQIKTALTRGLLDNTYLAQNGRYGADVTRVNIDDLLVSRPGGVIRVNGGDPSTAIFPITHPDTSAGSLSGLEYMDAVRENRTGYTRQSQGLDTDALVNKTVGATVIQLSQSQLRLEMIARTIAETGVRDLFRITHALTQKHATKAEKVRLRNKWVVVNPREWVRRTDLSLSVGLGTSTTTQLVQNIMLLGQAQEKVVGLGLVGPQEIFNLLKKLPAACGFKNAEEFFKAPQPGPPGPDGKPTPPQMPQSPPPQVQVEQMRQQGEQAKMQQDGQIETAKLQLQDQMKQRELASAQQIQASNDARDWARTQAELQLKDQMHQRDVQMQAQLKQMELQMQDIQHQREMDNAIRIAYINAEAKTAAAAEAANASRDNAVIAQESAGTNG